MSVSSREAKPFVLLTLAGTAYALASEVVQQMEMIEHITPVPNASPFVDGVVLVRGQVVPVVNLRVRFGFPRVPNDLKTRLIVIAHQGRTVGLLVDSASEFIRLDEAAIKPPPDAVTGLSGEYLAGIVNVNNRIVLILNVEEILTFKLE